MQTSEVLEQLDDALDDWSVSIDAMRCGAPPGTAAAGPPPMPPGYGLPPAGQVVLGFDSSPDSHVSVSAIVLDEVVHVFIDEAIADFRRRYRHLCCAARNVAPLAIDGRAYRRRQLARRRRRRR